MSAADVWSEAAGLNGRSYNTSKLGPISAIFSRTLSCSAWASSHVSLTPNATQVQGGGEVFGALTWNQGQTLQWFAYLAQLKRLLLPKAVCSNFLRQFEDTPECRFSFLNCGVKITRDSFIPAAITADCPIYTWNQESSCAHITTKSTGSFLFLWWTPSLFLTFVSIV